MTEDKFPTIADLRDRISELIDKGLGALMASGNLYQRSGVWYVRVQDKQRDRRISLRTADETVARERMLRVLKEIAAADHPRMRSLLIEDLARQTPIATRGQWVYFIQRESGGPIKIGRSNSPKARLAHLQTACGVALRLLCQIPAAPDVESLLHARFSRERLTGEWFRPTARLRNFISALLERAGTKPAHYAAVRAPIIGLDDNNSVSYDKWLSGDAGGR